MFFVMDVWKIQFLLDDIIKFLEIMRYSVNLALSFKNVAVLF